MKDFKALSCLGLFVLLAIILLVTFAPMENWPHPTPPAPDEPVAAQELPPDEPTIVEPPVRTVEPPAVAVERPFPPKPAPDLGPGPPSPTDADRAAADAIPTTPVIVTPEPQQPINAPQPNNNRRGRFRR